MKYKRLQIGRKPEDVKMTYSNSCFEIMSEDGSYDSRAMSGTFKWWTIKGKTTGQSDITITLQNSYYIKLKLIVIGDAAKEINDTVYKFKGYISDKNRTKLEQEGDWNQYSNTGTAKHLFFSSKSKERIARDFISSYDFIDNISAIRSDNGENSVLPQDMKFKQTTVSGAKVWKADTSFNFKASKAGKVYTRGISYIDGKAQPSVWYTKTIKKDHKYSATYSFIYNEETKEMVYMVVYDVADSSTAQSAIENAEQTVANAENEYANNRKTVSMQLYVLGLAEETRDTVPYSDVLNNIDFYTDVGDINTTDAQKVETTVSKIISIITNIGIILSAIILAIMGVKYMIGSAEERAEYKKDMIPYLVGATLLFSICIVMKIIQFLGQEINNI